MSLLETFSQYFRRRGEEERRKALARVAEMSARLERGRVESSAIAAFEDQIRWLDDSNGIIFNASYLPPISMLQSLGGNVASYPSFQSSHLEEMSQRMNEYVSAQAHAAQAYAHGWCSFPLILQEEQDDYSPKMWDK